MGEISNLAVHLEKIVGMLFLWAILAYFYEVRRVSMVFAPGFVLLLFYQWRSVKSDQQDQSKTPKEEAQGEFEKEVLVRAFFNEDPSNVFNHLKQIQNKVKWDFGI